MAGATGSQTTQLLHRWLLIGVHGPRLKHHPSPIPGVAAEGLTVEEVTVVTARKTQRAGLTPPGCLHPSHRSACVQPADLPTQWVLEGLLSQLAPTLLARSPTPLTPCDHPCLWESL